MGTSVAEKATRYPRFRYMGSKHRLLPWLAEELSALAPVSAIDAFAGSGCVSYLLKTIGARVRANDFLRLGATIAHGLVVNATPLSENDVAALCSPVPEGAEAGFCERTFSGIFFTPSDLRFLDAARGRAESLDADRRALALAVLARACLKAQPRGVFTFVGARYDDGRRDLSLGLEGHVREGASELSSCVFDDGQEHDSVFGDAFDLDPGDADLVYMDPPYVPRSDDNCYVKRYHFVEGLMSHWQAPEVRIMPTSKVKKLEKRRTPFSYRSQALDAFDRLFARFADARLVLSYSSNGWPDLPVLVDLMKAHKRRVKVKERPHRYSFGTHGAVHSDRAKVMEYLIIGE